MKKIAIVTTHPIQYNAPLFKLLAASKQLDIKVFYTWSQSEHGLKYDPGFGKLIEWDIPLLEGYNYSFVKNIAIDAGTHHFKGIINPSLIAEIEVWNPSALLIFGWSFSSHLKCIRYFYKKIPVFFRGDSTLLDKSNSVKKILRFVLLHWIYAHIDFGLYTGVNNKAYFLKYGLKEKQLLFAPHAIDNERFAHPAGDFGNQAIQQRKLLGIDDKDVVLLFAGKFEEKKNPFYLIEIAKRVANPRLKILFVGDGKLEISLKLEASKDQRISFLSFRNQSEMPLIYSLGDVFILPSVGPGETWGLAANEAMASGLAVMMSNKAGGAADLIHGGINGIVFDPNNFEKSVSFINRILDERTFLDEMKQVSKKIIQQFSYESFVAVLEQLAENATAKK